MPPRHVSINRMEREKKNSALVQPAHAFNVISTIINEKSPSMHSTETEIGNSKRIKGNLVRQL